MILHKICFFNWIVILFTPFVVQEWYPPTTAVHLQTPTLDSFINLAYCCKLRINEGLYFRSPRLATRFESNAAGIAKVLVKAFVKLNYKIQYPRNSGSKKQSRPYFLRFFLKNSSSK